MGKTFRAAQTDRSVMRNARNRDQLRAADADLDRAWEAYQAAHENKAAQRYCDHCLRYATPHVRKCDWCGRAV